MSLLRVRRRFVVACLVALAGAVLLFALGGREERPASESGVAASVVPGAVPAGPASAEERRRARGLLPSSTRERRAQDRRTLRRVKRAERRRAARLASPQLRRERVRSRTAFSKRDAAGALAVAEEEVPSVLDVAAVEGPQLAPKQSIVGFVSDTTALVKREGSERLEVVQSLGVPMAVPAAEAEGAADTRPGTDLLPIDLKLVAGEGGFEPVRSRVETKLPSKLSDGLKIGAVRVGLSAAAVPAQAAGSDKLFYASADVDTDAVVEAVPTGASVNWVLRSRAAPERLRFDLGGVNGLRLLPDGSLEAVDDSGAKVEISEPVASDAQGQPVEVGFAIGRDRSVSVEVTHRRQDLAYPIVVDPVVSVGGVWAVRAGPGYNVGGSSWGGIWNPAGWVHTNPWPNIFTLVNWDGRMGIKKTASAPTDHWSGFEFDPPRNAAVFRAEFEGVRHQGNYSCVDIGLLTAAGAWSESGFQAYWNGSNPGPDGLTPPTGSGAGYFENCPGMGADNFIRVCPSSNCGWGGSANNRAIFFIRSLIAGGDAYAGLTGAYVWYRDIDAPTITSLTGLPGGWTNTTAPLSATISASDTGGVGICGAAVVDASAGGYAHWPLAVARTASNIHSIELGASSGPTNCTGEHGSYAPESATMAWSEGSPAWGGAQRLPEGSHQVRFGVSDILGNRGTTERTVKIDRTAPHVLVSGRLGAYVTERTGSGLPAGIRTLTGTSDLVLEIKDKTGSTTTSGLYASQASIVKLTDDGMPTSTMRTLYGPEVASCNGSDDCGRAAQRFPWGAYDIGEVPDFGPGLYQLQVATQDRAGNIRNAKYVFARGGGEISSVAEGQATARWVPLQARRTSGSPSQATFQWSTGTRAWADVPGEAVLSESTGSPHGSATVATPAYSGGWSTGRWVLDIEKLIEKTNQADSAFTDLTNGQLKLRAIFNGSGTQWDKQSEDVAIRLDRGGRDTKDETTSIGPGSVDLLTGNFAMSSTDASLAGYQSGVSLSRTYHSRYVLKGDGTPAAEAQNGVLGPGWNLSLPADGVSQFVRVVDMDDPARDAFVDRWIDDSLPSFDPDALPEERYGAVRVETSDGSGFVFERRDSDGVYVPELGFENYQLTRTSVNGGATASGFVLKDRDGDASMTFDKRLDDPAKPWYEGQPEHGTFGIGETSASSIVGHPQWTYASRGNGKHVQQVPVRVVAAVGAGITGCNTAVESLPRGCQALSLTYDQPADAPVRLTKVTITAWDPAASARRSEDVVSYGYDATPDRRLTAVTDLRSNLTVGYAYGSDGLLSTVTPPGEAAHVVAYESYSDDKSRGRLKTSARAGGGTWSVMYSDRTLMGTNPWDLSTDTVARWGQEVTPFRAAAVFAPNVTLPAGWSVASGSNLPNQATLQRASISYLDALGRKTNQADPGERISVADYDKWGNITRTLTPAARVAALEVDDDDSASQEAQEANRRATITSYEVTDRGTTRPTRVVGPERDVKLASGSLVRGRSLTKTVYDEGISIGDPKMPYNLPTTVESGAVTGMATDGSGGTEQELRKTVTEYNNLTHRQPTTITQNPGGPNENIRKFFYDADGKEIERRQPKSHATAGSQGSTLTSYYVATGTPSATSCDGRPEWVGLVCKVEPGGTQPGSGLRKLPTKRFEYDYWRRASKVVETAKTSSGVDDERTTLTTYDGKDRPYEESILTVGSGVGTAVEKVRHVYDATGRETATRHIDSGGGTIREISREYDNYGRITTYQDSNATALRGKEVTTYDPVTGRVSGVTQYRGAEALTTKTYGYDATTGYLTSISDSGFSSTAIQASYDLDGRITRVYYPNGITKIIGYDDAGAVRRMSYQKTSGCTSSCLWYDNTVERSAHGQIVTDNSTLGNRSYVYDALGRLTSASDRPASQACTTRTYAHDANSNRESRRSNTASTVGAACPSPGSGGSVVTSTYDAADRQLTAATSGTGNLTYDAWGRVLSLPSQATGGQPVVSTYFANDLARSIQNGSITITNTLDPNDRVRTRSTSTSTPIVETYGYGDDSDEPIWVSQANQATPNTETAWSRYVEDPAGDLAATVTKAGVKQLQVSNVRGDTVAEIAASGIPAGLGAKFAVDEFGVPTGTSMGYRKYGFIGSKQRESLQYGNVVAMGLRTYSPHTGRFLQTDPVVGGSANTYEYATQDPVNAYDLGGLAVESPTRWTFRQSRQTWHNERIGGKVVSVPSGRVTVQLTLTIERNVEDGRWVLSARMTTWASGRARVAKRGMECRHTYSNFPDGNCGSSKAGDTVKSFSLGRDPGGLFHVDFSWTNYASPRARGVKHKKSSADVHCSDAGCRFYRES